MQQQHRIHVGKLIRERLKEEGKSVVWLAQELGCHRTNVYNIFEKNSLDTNILRRISIIMRHNFFDYLQEDTQKQIDSRPSPALHLKGGRNVKG
jgi:hypothetical protein